jgi:hypothetical protein
MRSERGSAGAGFALMLIVLALSASLLDIYSLATAKAWADRVCQEASLVAVSTARDLAAYVQTGRVRVDPDVADQVAREVVALRAQQRGYQYSVQVEVLEEGGSVPGFPPAGSILGRDFAGNDPAVGVYLEVEVPTAFMKALGFGNATRVHAFAASSLSSARRS